MENNKKFLLDYLNNKEKLEDFHLCEICKDILQNPVSCKHCESNFCSECIQLYVNQNNSECPDKCKFEEIKPSKLVFKALDVLQFKCSNVPCEEILNYSNYFTHHLKNCKYMPIPCTFCKKQFVQLNYEEHVSQCDDFESNCDICGIKTRRKEFLKHDTTACLKEFAKITKKEKNVLDSIVKKMATDIELLQMEVIRKQDLNKLLETEILKKDEQNQEIRSRLENLERKFNELKQNPEELNLKLEEQKRPEDDNYENENIHEINQAAIGWDPLLSRQGRCTIDPTNNKKLKIDSESCWNHFVINKHFTNESFNINFEMKVVQEHNYVYFGIINEFYSNSNSCMCQSPRNSFYIRCNGDISIDANKTERKDLAWFNQSVIVNMKVLLREKQIYFSIAQKELAGPYVIHGKIFKVVAGTCNKAKGEINILSCCSIIKYDHI